MNNSGTYLVLQALSPKCLLSKKPTCKQVGFIETNQTRSNKQRRKEELKTSINNINQILK